MTIGRGVKLVKVKLVKVMFKGLKNEFDNFDFDQNDRFTALQFKIGVKIGVAPFKVTVKTQLLARGVDDFYCVTITQCPSFQPTPMSLPNLQ